MGGESTSVVSSLQTKIQEYESEIRNLKLLNPQQVRKPDFRIKSCFFMSNTLPSHLP